MLNWLFEGRLSVYLALAATALFITLNWWSRSRFAFYELRARGRSWEKATRKHLNFEPLLLSVIVPLIGAYFVLDCLVETSREQIARKLREITIAVRERNVDAVLSNVAESFRFRKMDKNSFRAFVAEYLADGEVNDLTIWDVTFLDDSGGIEFKVKVRGPHLRQEAFGLIRGAFVPDGDGQWRLQTIEIFQPFSDTNAPVVLPDIP